MRRRASKPSISQRRFLQIPSKYYQDQLRRENKMKQVLKLSIILGAVAAWMQAASFQLTFEGMKNQEQVADFYNGGTGGGQYDEAGVRYANGASMGAPNYGVSFGGNALAVISEDAGGTGLFNNNPSGATVLAFNNVIKANSYMNVAKGFTTGIAFWYSQPFYPITIKIYDGLNGTGKLLATANLPQSRTDCPVDKKGKSVANCFTPTSIPFQGIAKSVDFTDANFSAFDNLTIGDVVSVPIPPLAPPVSTCPIPNGIKSFVLEHQLDGGSFVSSFIPSFSPEQFAVFFDPTKEIHTRFEFNTSDMVVRATSYWLPIGGPPTAPAGADLKSRAVAFAVIPIDKIYTSCSPRPSIAVTGYVGDSTPVYGSMVGLPHWIAFSFDPANKTNTYNAANITTVNAGTTSILGAVGSVTVVPATTVAKITNAPVIKTLYRQVLLDGSQSLTDAGPLTYRWSSTSGSVATSLQPGFDTFSAAIIDPTAAQTRFTIGGTYGDYPVTLTVTSAKGETSTATVIVRYAAQ